MSHLAQHVSASFHILSGTELTLRPPGRGGFSPRATLTATVNSLSPGNGGNTARDAASDSGRGYG